MNFFAALVNHLATTTAAGQNHNSFFDFLKRIQATDSPSNTSGTDFRQELDMLPYARTPQEWQLLHRQYGTLDTQAQPKQSTVPYDSNNYKFFPSVSTRPKPNSVDMGYQQNYSTPKPLLKATVTPPKTVRKI